jgi:hypothetical protein
MDAREEIELVLHLLRSLIDRTHNMGTGIGFEHSYWLDKKLSDVESDMKSIGSYYDEQTKK